MICEKGREVEKKMDFVCLFIIFFGKPFYFVFLTNVFIFFHSFDPLFFLPFFIQANILYDQFFLKLFLCMLKKMI